MYYSSTTTVVRYYYYYLCSFIRRDVKISQDKNAAKGKRCHNIYYFFLIPVFSALELLVSVTVSLLCTGCYVDTHCRRKL